MTTEKSNEQNNNTLNKSTSGIKSILPILGGSGFTNGLAIILIFGSIASIITLIIVHITTISSDKEVYSNLIDKTINTSNASNSRDILDSFQNFYRETNASNSNILSIILPVIGTWVGAILAFYYGNKNLERISDNLNTTINALGGTNEDEEKLKDIKIKDVLDQFKDYKDVEKAKITEIVGQRIISLGIRSTVLLTDEKDQPLGFLSIYDITNSTPITKEQLKTQTISFKDFFKQNNIKDSITDRTWDEEGVHNYATILLDDTLAQAQQRMKVISEKQSVRGLVLDKNVIAGVITMDLFSKAMLEL